jgi:hypothetical protein
MRARDLSGLSDLHLSNKRLFGTSAAIAKPSCIVVNFPSSLTFAVQFDLLENMAEKARQEHRDWKFPVERWWGRGHKKAERALLDYAVSPWSQERPQVETMGISKLLKRGLHRLFSSSMQPRACGPIIEAWSRPA